MSYEKNSKMIGDNSFIVDVNMVEAPLFIFKPSKSTKTVQHWLENPEVSSLAKEVLGRRKSKNDFVEYMRWSDSRGNDREILASSQNKLPNGFAMDVLFTLIAIYIKKSPPIHYNDESKIYDLPTRKVECSLSEICKYMKISDAGGNIKRIKDAVDDLFMVSYHCLTEGIIYDSKNEEFHKSTKGIRLLDYEILDKEQRVRRQKQTLTVTFGDIILASIEKSFIRFLNNDMYFALKSGLTRRLYTYLEGNRHNKAYIIRKFNTLRYKMPIDFSSRSHLKRKLSVPLENLIKHGIIVDYLYPDEFNINVPDKNVIYFIFKGTKAKLIKELEKKYSNSPIISVEEPNEVKDMLLTFPDDIEKELDDIGINCKKKYEILNKYSKYKIVEYILWLKDGISKNKIKDPAAMFIFAITDEMVKVKKTHPHIIEFIENHKRVVEGKKEISEKIIRAEYEKYFEIELEKFIIEDEFGYNTIKDNILEDMKEKSPIKIKQQKSLYKMANTEEKAGIMTIISKWEDFNVKESKSDLYKEMLNKKICLYRELKMYEDFRIEYINNNK